MTSRRGRLGVGLFVLVLLLAPAAAKAEKAVLLKRSANNLWQAPIDFLFAPYTFFDTAWNGYVRSKRFSPTEKVLLSPVVGVVYTPVCMFADGMTPMIRLFEGVAMLPLGVAAVNTDADPHLYEPNHGKRGAVIDKGSIYLGGRYCEGFFQ